MKRRGKGEGSVYQRGTDGRWVAEATINGKRKQFYGPTKRGVTQRLRKFLTAVDLGHTPPTRAVNLGAYVDEWLDYKQPRVRPGTFKSYSAKAAQLKRELGGIPLGRLVVMQVERLMSQQLSAGVPPRSVHHLRAVLSNALNDAMRWGLIDRNVAALAKPPSVPEREVRALTVEDAKNILAAVEGDRLEPLFTVPLTLGLRQGEALAVRWTDVDFDAGTLRIERTLQRVDGEYCFLPPKSKRSRRILPLPDPVIRALHAHRRRQLEERLLAGPAWEGGDWDELVFADEIGRPLSGFHVTKRFQKLLAAAGLPELRYHDLRHGAATLMAALGVPPRVAMEVLGHAQSSTTMEIYTHVAPELQREATDRVAEAIWGGS